MVEYNQSIDGVFAALADPIRRDILERARHVELTVNEIALDYDISLAAISRHLKVLAEANLIQRRRHGKYIMVRTQIPALTEAELYLSTFRNE